MQTTDAAVLFDLGAAAVTSTFAAFIGGVLGLPPSQITVSEAVVTPGAAVSTDTSAYVPLQACNHLTAPHCLGFAGAFRQATQLFWRIQANDPAVVAICSSSPFISRCAFTVTTGHERLICG